MNSIQQPTIIETNDSLIFSKKDLIFIAIAVFIAGWIVKIPRLIQMEDDLFIARNISFIIFPLLIFYFTWKKNIPYKTLLIPASIVALSAIFINLLPANDKSDTLILSCMHLPILIWSLVGYSFIGSNLKNVLERVGFLRFNGDLVVMGAVMALSAALFTAITIGLYELIDIDIQEFYVDYVVTWGLPAIPIIATVLVTNNPTLVGRVSPIIAKIFTPFVFVSLAIFLGAIIGKGKDPYNDREFLVVFNGLLIGVMAIILFSLSEITKGKNNKIQLLFLVGLSLLTIIENGIALSAIVFRLAEYGVSPNRMAVLGSNLLMLTHLSMIAYQLIKILNKDAELIDVEKTIGKFLPLYAAWTVIVVFLFPVLFGYK
jgi:hypothetical protein